MMAMEAFGRIVSSICTQHGVGLIVGTLTASFLMLHNETYINFFVVIDQYISNYFYMVLGGT